MRQGIRIGLLLTGVVALLAGCAQPPLNPGADKVVVSGHHPSSSCKFVGDLHGKYGDVVRGQFISTKHLQAGSVNHLKNAAHAKGADYVELIRTEGTISGDYNYDYVNRVYVTGKAYRCPSK